MFSKSPDYKYVPYDIRKGGRTSSCLATIILGAPPPLILGFHPSKRHAARITSALFLIYLGITRTEAFLMASSASYPDVRSMAFSRSIVLMLLTIYEYHVISAQSCFNLILILVAWS